MRNTDSFGDWFRPIVEASGLKKVAIANEADISPVTFSRILNGGQGIAKETAAKLARAINTLTGREVANVDQAIQMAVGISQPLTTGFFKGLDKLSPERQELARRQIRAIIDSLAEQEEHDTNYIDDED